MPQLAICVMRRICNNISTDMLNSLSTGCVYSMLADWKTLKQNKHTETCLHGVEVQPIREEVSPRVRRPAQARPRVHHGNIELRVFIQH